MMLHKNSWGSLSSNLPELALRAESFGQDVLIRRLIERTLDFALVYEPAKLTEIISVPVNNAELVLVTTTKEQDVDSALNNNYVSVDWGISFDITHAQFFQNVNPPVLHTTLAKIALEFILQHGGSAYLPLRLVTHYLNKKIYHIESAPVINRPIFACYHQDNLHTETINHIIQIIKEFDN